MSRLFFFHEFILRVAPGVMVNDLLKSFHITAESLGFMNSAFFQAYSWMQIPVGIIFDKFSTRKVLFVACLVCAVGAILFASTTIFWVGFLGCLLTGIGAGFGFFGVLKVAEQWLPANKFAFTIGLLISLGFLGGMISDNLLEWFIHQNS